MGSAGWIAIGAIVICSIITRGVVNIIRASKSGAGKLGPKIEDLEEELHDLKQDMAEARKRIEVLEKIVTDQKFDLGRQIDDLASSQ